MDERIRFVIRLKDGESMAALCREFQISRKTGYKIFERYEECGLEGLTDRARRPQRYANQLPEQIEAAIVAAKREKPNWGARKIRERLLRRLPSEVKVPARSTIHTILDRHGLVARSRRSRSRSEGTPLSEGASPNCCGVLTTRESSCSPIGATVIRSRSPIMLRAICCCAKPWNRMPKRPLLRPLSAYSRSGVCRKRSAPITAFPSLRPTGFSIFRGLSVWWLRLGISIERIRPGHPQQNGRHERMHLTLKKKATRPAGANLLQQQAKFDAFIEEFNNERPHEALNMKCPAEVYSASCRPYRGIQELYYPFHDKTVVVTNCGRLCLYRKKINLSTCLAGQAVGVKEVDEGIWLVSFMDYDLGYIDLEEKTLQPLNNPFGPKVLPMS